jgi:hypothetical protein
MNQPAAPSFQLGSGHPHQLTVLTQGAGDLLHRFDAGAHHLAAPFIEELSGPERRAVIPELLKGFREKVGAEGLQIIAEQIAKAETLLGLEVLFAF